MSEQEKKDYLSKQEEQAKAKQAEESKKAEEQMQPESQDKVEKLCSEDEQSLNSDDGDSDWVDFDDLPEDRDERYRILGIEVDLEEDEGMMQILEQSAVEEYQKR